MLPRLPTLHDTARLRTVWVMASEHRVLTIGNFDGVHLGHARLLSRAREIAGPNGSVTALVFDPHPRAVLTPGSPAPQRLTTFEQRRDLLRELGADDAIRLTPTPALLSMEPEAFVEELVDEHTPTWIVEGHDFRFGKARRGDEHLLRAQGESHGFGVTIVDEHEVALSDQQIVRASSSIARWLVAHGRMQDASRVLGRPYRVTGTVEQGDRRGRALWFPTANVRTPNAFPADGVYASVARLADGREFACALHVGERPVFDDTTRTIEAHLLDWAGPLAEGGEEYGWPIELDVIAYLRDQMGFSSVDGLIEQIERDCARTRDVLDGATTEGTLA